MKPFRVLALVALLLASSLAAPGLAQSETRPITEDRWELAGLDGDQTRNDIDFAPRNATFDARFRFLAREDIQDTLDVRVDRGVVNRSSIPVDVVAGDVFSASVEVSRIRETGSEGAELVASLRNTTWRDGAVRVTDRIHVVPQPRAELLQPPNLATGHLDPEDREDARRRHGTLEVDWNEAVEVRARLENPWDVPTRPLPLGVRGQGQVVEGRTISPLAPGETRVVSVAEVTRGEVTRSISHGRDPVRQSPQPVRLSLTTAPAEEGEREALWNYTYPSADLDSNPPARGVVEFHAGLDVRVGSADLVLGEETTLPVEIRNRGGVPARPTPVDLRVGPVPDLAYGVESGTSRSLTVDLAPGEERSLDLTFTPRVGANHEVAVTIQKPDHTRGQSDETAVGSPVDLRVPDGERASLEVGETAEATVVVEGPPDLEGDLGVVATVREARRGVDGDPRGTPFSTLLTTSDLVGASFDPASVEAASGDGPVNRTVSLEVTPKAAGQLAVVPVLRSGGLVHTGLEDGDALWERFRRSVDDEPEDGRRDGRPLSAFVSLDVFPSGEPGLTVVVPPALVLLGVAGVEVHRRWFLR